MGKRFDVLAIEARAQAAYDRAQAELDQLNAATPGAELQALIDAANADLAKLPGTRSVAELEALMKRVCPARTALNGQAKAACPKYDVELGRAWEKQRLVSRMLSDRPATERERGAANGARTVCAPTVSTRKRTSSPNARRSCFERFRGSQQGEAPTRLKLLQMVTDAAGVLRTSERALGSRLGISSTRARRLLSELAASGAIKLRASSTGTTITLLADGRA